MFSLSAHNTLRIVHVSDTHNQWVDVSTLPPADILIHTGDFSNRGTEAEFREFNFWLGEAQHLYPTRIVVLGNHDVITHGRNFDKMVGMLSNATHVPNSELLQICGLRMLCLPYLRYTGAELENVIQNLSQHRHIDLLLTHAPGYGVLDLSHAMVRCGSMAIKRIILAVRPKCHLFGHVHEDYGFRQDGLLKVLSVNSSMCDHPVVDVVNRGHMILFQVEASQRTTTDDDSEEIKLEERKQFRLLGIMNI